MTRLGLRKSGSVSSVYMRDKQPPEPETDSELAEEVPDEKEEEDEDNKDQITEIDAEQILVAPLSLEI